MCCKRGDPIFTQATIAIVRVMIGFGGRGRVRIKIRIRIRIRVGVTYTISISVYHWSNCRRSKCRTFVQEHGTRSILAYIGMTGKAA